MSTVYQHLCLFVRNIDVPKRTAAASRGFLAKQQQQQILFARKKHINTI